MIRRLTNRCPRTGLALLCVFAALPGCTTLKQALHPGFDRPLVAAKVAERTGYEGGVGPGHGEVFFPNGACLEDGLEEDEAILIALWNNAAFQEVLLDLGIARGDLITAGLLPNPTFLYYFSAPFKPYRWLVDFPLESLWLRPIRIKGARREAERVSERLTQAGLDLIRDVRQAYADVLVAQGRLQVAEQAVQIRGEIARLAQAQFRAENVSAQEAATAQIGAYQAQQAAAPVRYDVALAEERLRNLLAIGAYRGPLVLTTPPPPLRADLDAEALTQDAVNTRPDVLAANRNVAAAYQRLRLARIGWIQFLGILDATTGNLTDHEFGPGFRVTIPVFNWNQGNKARAAADLERAERNLQTIRNQIILDVHNAHFRYTQARTEIEILDAKVLPEINNLIRRSEAAYREGEATYVVVLQATQQFVDARLRYAILQGDLRRWWAELERSVGKHLDAPPISGDNQLPAPTPVLPAPAPKENSS